MNYSQTIQDTIRILRTTKLVWAFGFLSLLMTIVHPLSQFVRDNPQFVFIYIPISLALMYFSLIAIGSFIYIIHQKTLERNLTFSDAWIHSKTKVFSIIGSSFPVILLALLVSIVYKFVMPNLSFLWLIEFMTGSFICSFFYFSTCAIMINNVKAVSAIRVGFLVAINNFIHVLIIAGTAYIIRISLTSLVVAFLWIFDFPANQKVLDIPVTATAVWIFYLILIVPTSLFLTLGYLTFTKKISYPAP